MREVNHYDKFSENHNLYDELTLYFVGKETCEPGHLYCGIRNHYLLHYIISGKGTLILKGKTYELSKNQGFFCPANIKVYYEADSHDPWSYYWIGFNGSKAKKSLEKVGLSSDSPIFTYDIDSNLYHYYEELYQTKNIYVSKFFLNSKINELFYLLTKVANPINNDTSIQENHIQKALLYINQNFPNDISVEDIATYIGVSRKYLCYLFNKFFKTSTHQYLIEHRIKEACELFKNHNLSITEAAHSVGYNDRSVFSKAFKKIVGISPSEYIEKVKNN